MILERIKTELEQIKNNHNLRKLKSYPENLINLSSNDYLNLANDLDLRTEFYETYKNLSLSSSSSRLITGTFPLVLELENKLKEIYKKEALILNSGFEANCCIIETFCNKSTLIISDKLNHASIHDGIINSGAELIRYKHLDLEHLESILIKYTNQFDEILVISETVYSMDGDMVDLKKLVDLKKKYNFILMLDEAHSYAVYGYGLAYEFDLINYIDFLVIPLGKGGGSMGSYVLCDSIYKDYIINRGRKFIYTTALPPINIAWNLFLLDKIGQFSESREHLYELTKYAMDSINELNLKTISTTHIISIIIGNNQKIEILCQNLIAKGFLVYGVKEPTVPKGTARIRIGLNPSITKEQLNLFFKELKNELDALL
ncbi:MAG: aminotransferase class I/II-fold pyridoxal phosphate-dependent enzyme [Cetobacterium sp.]|uniref:aminotransferase class I/II-fold pyridoxal phosphate-dependent enzyme n=1 Tax=unclassified Cetobacterium TaxID=2630983 RepID=UPI00163C6AF7|nr:aminotransferase class I/II-fold pyridoxal phosphate-dependent enzyme [Cetobacterium sp. 2A]MBC2855867.1 aminotransferase class I/II-fold pyridoxal phosphate-dependent enzyme [Cetobacterium sp. 2A]